MKKKVAAIFLAGCILTAFASCDSSANSKNESSKTASTTTPAVTEDQTAPVTTEELVEPDYPVLKADENSITFNDSDDLFTAHCMNTADFTDGESNCNLSVAEYKGEKQLKIQVLDKGDEGYNIPKIVFDVDELVGSENLSKIKSFSIDVTQVAVGEFIGDDGTAMLVPGNLIGGFGSVLGEDCDEWYEPTGSSNNFATEEWNFDWEYYHAEGKWLLKSFVDGTKDSTLVFMRWSIPNQADIYLDNLTFYDADGKSIPIVYQPGTAQTDAASADGAQENADQSIAQ